MDARLFVSDAGAEGGVRHRNRGQTELPRLERVRVVMPGDRLDEAVLRFPQVSAQGADVLGFLRAEPPDREPRTEGVRLIVARQAAQKSKIVGIGKRRQRVGAERERLGLRVVGEPAGCKLVTCPLQIRNENGTKM